MRKTLYEVFFMYEDHYWDSRYFLAASKKSIADHIKNIQNRRLVIYTIEQSTDDPSDVNPTDLTSK
jgi:hypothetical protein